MEGSCNDKGVDGMRKKPKESEDEVFSDAVAEFSEGVGPNKSVGDASNLVSTSKMVAEDEMNSSQTLKDREILGKFNVGEDLSFVLFPLSDQIISYLYSVSLTILIA